MRVLSSTEMHGSVSLLTLNAVFNLLLPQQVQYLWVVAGADAAPAPRDMSVRLDIYAIGAASY